ncbi:MAG TPA: ATP-binding protein [Acidobacteriota bacterium]|nr:ATP-binding protein [Acidobacteriota bacterium]
MARRTCWPLLTFFGAVTLLGAAGGSAASDRSDRPPLTTVERIQRLTPADAERRYPVHFRAVATYCDPAQDTLFVHDGTAGIFVDISEPHHYRINPGQLVDVEGFTAPGEFAPIIIEPTLKTVGVGRMPLPHRASLQKLFTGGEDCEWVEIRGVVRSTAFVDGLLRIAIAEGASRVEAVVRDFPPKSLPALADTLVTIRGVSGGLFNDKGQMISTVLFVPNMEQLAVQEPAPADPFTIQIRSISKILEFVPIRGYGHRVRIRGVATFQRAGLCLFVHDETAGIYVTSTQKDELVPGDIVEAVGFPEVGDYTPVLRDAIYRRTGTGPDPAAQRVLPDRAVKGAYDTELVEIEGRLLNKAHVLGERVFVLQSGYLTFDAHLEERERDRRIDSIPEGSLLRLKGICSVQADELRRPKSFRILLRGAADVVILQRPSWWTLQYTLTTIGILLAAVVSVLAWVFVLNRRVRKQTAIIGQRLEREAALEHQLQQVQKMEAIGCLAGGIAHDFNNLLTAIQGYSELILSQLTPHDPILEEVREITKAGERASALTRQLLAFSRRQVLQPKILDLNDVVREMDRMLNRLIGEDIDLICRLDPQLGKVKADPSQIEQVIMNMAVNARDAMPSGGTVTIETSNVYLLSPEVQGDSALPPGSYVRLAMTDTGCGMDEATRERIFDPFFTTKELGKGTGLGLATVYGIVKQSGGEITVESKPGLGTTFVIHLPSVAAKPEPEKVPERSSTTRGKETVLVVEDEDGVRTLVRQILSHNGYVVLEAKNGEEALELAARNGHIHLLATDVVMPKMDGCELAERLIPLRPGMKVLFLSGHTDDAIVHHGVLKDGTPFLQKPFTPSAFAEKVRAVLDS